MLLKYNNVYNHMSHQRHQFQHYNIQGNLNHRHKVLQSFLRKRIGDSLNQSWNIIFHQQHKVLTDNIKLYDLDNLLLI